MTSTHINPAYAGSLVQSLVACYLDDILEAIKLRQFATAFNGLDGIEVFGGVITAGSAS